MLIDNIVSVSCAISLYANNLETLELSLNAMVPTLYQSSAVTNNHVFIMHRFRNIPICLCTAMTLKRPLFQIRQFEQLQPFTHLLSHPSVIAYPG